MVGEEVEDVPHIKQGSPLLLNKTDNENSNDMSSSQLGFAKLSTSLV
jgi:hypothetical protein